MSQTSRRDFVATLLGAPVAWAACRAPATKVPDGELLLPGKALGHQLRDGLGMPAAIRDDAWLRTRVAIVGSGVAGLAAAWWLERAGITDVLVLELDDAVGGTSRSDVSPVTAYPWGAHYIVAPRPEQRSLIALLAELGALDSTASEPTASEPTASEPGARGAALAGGAPLAAEQALCREPEERLFYQGRWYEGLYLRAGAAASDLAELERFQTEIARWVAFRDPLGRRAFDLPASLASDAPEVTALDRQSFAGWLDAQGLRSPRLRWLADYACRDDYGLTAEDTSAWAGIGYFASRIAAPGDEPQPVLTWPEGNGRLTAQLSKHLGPRLKLRHAVTDIRQVDGEVELLIKTPEGSAGVRAERVIVATPQLVTQRIVAALRGGARPPVTLDRGAWAVANLHLTGRPKSRRGDAELSWDNVLYASPSLGYVVATHQGGRDHGPTVLTWYYPFTGDAKSARRELDGASREDWAAVALTDIARAHPDIYALCQRIDVAYWGHGMVRPRPGTIFDPALRAARAPLGHLHFAGSELSGVSLFEEALDHGVRAAAEVLEALRRARPGLHPTKPAGASGP